MAQENSPSLSYIFRPVKTIRLRLFRAQGSAISLALPASKSISGRFSRAVHLQTLRINDNALQDLNSP
jgi:hypothetical protein